jgi:type II secretory pathway component PulJ
MKKNRAFTLMELLTSIGLASIVLLPASLFLTQMVRLHGDERRMLRAMTEVERTIHLIRLETSMAGLGSPFLPGSSEDASKCLNRLEVSTDGSALQYVVSRTSNSATASAGRLVQTVGYKYDPQTKEFLRAQVDSTEHWRCPDTAVNPFTNTADVLPIADHVEQNGTEPVFTLNGNTLVMQISVVVPGSGGRTIRQNLSESIDVNL